MKRVVVFAVVVTMFLSACGQIKADVPDDPDAKATQLLVEEYIATNLNYDADGLMALYGDDLFWMDYGGNDGPLTRENLDYFVHETMAARDFEYKFSSYTITPGGRFAVIQTDYSQAAASLDKKVWAMCIAVLEFKDGKIISETWYYDGSVFH